MVALTACGPSASTQRPDPQEPHRDHQEHTPPPVAPDAGPALAAPDASTPSAADAGASIAPADPLAEERAAYDRARPVFDRFCASCHVRREGPRTAALRHFDMSTYPFGGHHATNLATTIRNVLGADGSRPTMPRDEPGSVQGADLALVLAWADAYDRAHAAGVHPPAHGRGH